MDRRASIAPAIEAGRIVADRNTAVLGENRRRATRMGVGVVLWEFQWRVSGWTTDGT